MVSKVVYSRNSDEYVTPDDLYGELDREFHFDVDVAATHENAKCRLYYTKEENGLLCNWAGSVWCNPPYSQNYKWCEKAFNERRNCENIVMLLPSRTDTKWWHDFVMRAYERRFIRGRVKFNGLPCGAPFPSVIVIW